MNESSLRDDERFFLTYAELELLLFATQEANSDKAQSIVRSRYKNLQKLGIPAGKRPAQGKRQKYNLVQVCEWVLAFELLQCGVDQTMVVEMLADKPTSDERRAHVVVYQLASFVLTRVNDPKSSTTPYYFAFSFDFLSNRWWRDLKRQYIVMPAESLAKVLCDKPRWTLVNFSELGTHVAGYFIYVKRLYDGLHP